MPGKSGNPGGRIRGRPYSIRTLIGEALRTKQPAVIKELEACLTSSKSILPTLELAAKVNHEIGAGPDGGMVVQIAITTNVDPQKLKGFAGQLAPGEDE